jgi:hypothetical protein
MSDERRMPVPSNVGANTCVLRGIGNFENSDRSTPEMAYSVYRSPCASTTL